MHKIYENDDLAMYVKKRYCHCCGNVLSTRQTERVVTKDDPEHRAYCHIGTSYKPHGDILVIGKEYYCEHCKKSFSCDQQSDIIEAQKYYQKNVVTTEEIDCVKSKGQANSIDKIKKMRWLLLIPLLGSMICAMCIFGSNLKNMTKDKDLIWLTLISAILFCLSELAMTYIYKMVISLGVMPSFFVNHQTNVIRVISLLSCNIPTLVYINHKF